jgi:tRNA/tmRNA/rRNA uracil-C5-methylase (TrmA/RlmC/RlmD family)
MKEWVQTAAYSGEAGMSKLSGSLLDLYSGVGSIGLTIGDDNVTLVEINEDAVREMKPTSLQNSSKPAPNVSSTSVATPSHKREMLRSSAKSTASAHTAATIFSRARHTSSTSLFSTANHKRYDTIEA